MPPFKNIVGNKYGKLTAIKFIGRKNKGSYWLFKCDCGNKKIIFSANVTGGLIRSCGCYRKSKYFRDFISKRLTTHGETLNGITIEYRKWVGMKTRCYNPKIVQYKDYGGRGIKMSDEWKNSYEQFLKDMGRQPFKGYSIDRINNNGNYCKENCRWVTIKEQERNKRTNIVYKNELMVDAAKRLGLTHQALSIRIKKRWSLEKAFNTPRVPSKGGHKRIYCHRGHLMANCRVIKRKDGRNERICKICANIRGSIYRKLRRLKK